MRQYNSYDILKVFAIILVVIGHVTIRYNGTTYPGHDTRLAQIITFVIYSFHMPLFMAISGTLFQLGAVKGKYTQFVPFIHDKAKRLLIPFVFVGCVVLVPAMLLLHITDAGILESYRSLLLGQDCRHLWYVLALFEIMVIHFFLRKAIKNKLLLFAFAVCAATLFSIFIHVDVFAINMAMRYYPYFLLGTLLPALKPRGRTIAAYALGGVSLWSGNLPFQGGDGGCFPERSVAVLRSGSPIPVD